MIDPTPLPQVPSEIIRLFDKSATKVFSSVDIQKIFQENRQIWSVGKSFRFQEFVLALTEQSRLSVLNLKFPSRTFQRFVWGKPSALELAVSLDRRAYLTHQTALYLHGLVEETPKTIFVNVEQSSKSIGSGKLEQEAIDNAFRGPQRKSQNIATIKSIAICLLNGRSTGQTGVIQMKGPDSENIRVTDIERTLLDAAVRPGYAGGPSQVLNAYKLGAKKIVLKRLLTYLQKIKFIYPYHQAIGFYLERSGEFKTQELEPLKKLGMHNDFYLDYGMMGRAYIKEWRLFVPPELE